MTRPPPTSDSLRPAAWVMARYGISRVTLWKWARDPGMGFPTPIILRGRRYWRLDDLIAFEAKAPRDALIEATAA